MRLFFGVLFCVSFWGFSQKNRETTAVDVNFIRGNVLPHTEDLVHLAGHTEGIMIDFLKQTHGNKEWHKAYNYPDYGAFFLYQNFNNDFLGKMYSAGLNCNFYFLKRHLQFKIGQGIAYATNPYNKETNSKNKAFGTEILNNTNVGLIYKKDNLLGNLGIQAGVLFTHYSNGRIKSPNSGINTFGLNLGINYNFDETKKEIDTVKFNMKFEEPIKYTFVFRTGINESQIIRSGQRTFYHFGFYADKRVNRKSAYQLGVDLFLTRSSIDFIKYKSVAFPELNIDPNTDYKRVGIFVGHELFINNISIEAQLGYYVYQPFKNDFPVYDRLGAKYYFNKNIFSSFHIKTHLVLAEAIEFGIGYRL